jgi:magnesium-transporting ATPase (P-type)
LRRCEGPVPDRIVAGVNVAGPTRATVPATTTPESGAMSATGLSSAEAARALQEAGPNLLADRERPHWPLRFARNFTHLFALLLWVGAALALVGGQPELSIAIVAVIIVNAMFSFIQEYRAERAVEALRRILPRRARVRRDGRTLEILVEEVVPDDVLLLAAGDRSAADGRLCLERALRVDMSALTGESRPVARHVTPDAGRSAEIDAVDRVFAGTHVVGGRERRSSPARGWRPRSAASPA